MMSVAYKYRAERRGEYTIQIPATVMLEFTVVADDEESALDQLYHENSRYPFAGRDGYTDMFDFGDTSIRVQSLSIQDGTTVDFVEYDESGVL